MPSSFAPQLDSVECYRQAALVESGRVWRNEEGKTLLLPGEDVLMSLLCRPALLAVTGQAQGSGTDVAFAVRLGRLLSLTSIELRMNPQLEFVMVEEREVRNRPNCSKKYKTVPQLEAIRDAGPTVWPPPPPLPFPGSGSVYQRHFCVHHRFDKGWKPLGDDLLWGDRRLQYDRGGCSHWSHYDEYRRTSRMLEKRWIIKSFNGCGPEIIRFLQLHLASPSLQDNDIVMTILIGLCLGGHSDLLSLVFRHVSFSSVQRTTVCGINLLSAAVWSRDLRVMKQVFPLAPDKRDALFEVLRCVPPKDAVEILCSELDPTQLTVDELVNSLEGTRSFPHSYAVGSPYKDNFYKWVTLREMIDGYEGFFNWMPLEASEALLDTWSSITGYIAQHTAFPYILLALCNAVSRRRDSQRADSNSPRIKTDLLLTIFQTRVVDSAQWGTMLLRLVEEYQVFSPIEALRCYPLDALSQAVGKSQKGIKTEVLRLMQLLYFNREQCGDGGGTALLTHFLAETSLTVEEQQRIAKGVALSILSPVPTYGPTDPLFDIAEPSKPLCALNTTHYLADVIEAQWIFDVPTQSVAALTLATDLADGH